MSLPLTTDRLYIDIPWEEKEWAKERGMQRDPDGKCWFLPPGRDPLPLRPWWSYLEKTYEDRAALKRKGCRYNTNLRKWYVPDHLDNLDFDDFTNWCLSRHSSKNRPRSRSVREIITILHDCMTL